jgi:hypothetical protein
MNSFRTGYNERSWAIDLIGHIKGVARTGNRPIKDAGGEQTLRTEGGSLFPDVLLFGDHATAKILQGWELKFPDTSIEDPEFFSNARIKAEALGLDSFLLWNVSSARLFIKDVLKGEYLLAQEWNDLADITSRHAVNGQRARWLSLLNEIIAVLNNMFESGQLEGRPFVEAYRSGGITALIMEHSDLVAEELSHAARRDSALRDDITLWWDQYQAEYGGDTAINVLAKANISNWIGKFLFANILKEKDSRARAVMLIDEGTTPSAALAIFAQLSRDCNFWTIFSDTVGLAEVPSVVWNQLKQLNRFLGELRLGSIDQSQLSLVLESTVEVAVRKLRGQYPTPIELARLLVHICSRNLEMDRILDPCCGSGTIARAAMELKIGTEVAPNVVAGAVYASDQDPQAVQIAAFALAKPDLMHLPLRLFQRDAFTLQPDTLIDYRDPSDGTAFTESLGLFDAIVSNLPFVAQAGRRQYGNAIARVNEVLGSGPVTLPGRSDVAAYLPFSLHSLLNDRGQLGVIITNAWLSTAWGDAFFHLLDRYYHLRTVITSGAGRWFKNSQVVTNILILEKRGRSDVPSAPINFVVLTRPLEEFADEAAVRVAAAQIRRGQTQNDSMTIRAVDPAKMARFRMVGLGGNAQFVNCDWVLDLPLIPLTSLFDVRRGERRGMNALFYPKAGHGIEPDYIRPLAKSFSDFTRLQSSATREAFCCNKSQTELRALGHRGALTWISRFDTAANRTRLAPHAPPGSHWYSMSADEVAKLVMTINYGDRLFVGRLEPPAFADQRLVCLDEKVGTDVELCHALLNSAISMFIIEGMGFGRGLGALDLSSMRIEGFMHMLNPSRISAADKQSIIQAFAPLLGRDILQIADELEQDDRKAFDEAVISAFGVTVSRQQIYDALLALVSIRQAARE